MKRLIEWLFPARNSIIPAEWSPENRQAFMMVSHVVDATAKTHRPR